MRTLLLPLALSVITLSTSAIAGDSVRGQELYESRCVGCHSPDANRVGPKHRGVVGRVSGTVSDFNYSKAVKAAQVIWDEHSLDQWLTNPQDFIPGQKMNFRVNDPIDRADLIAYLTTLK
jgi:cytochrome c